MINDIEQIKLNRLIIGFEKELNRFIRVDYIDATYYEHPRVSSVMIYSNITNNIFNIYYNKFISFNRYSEFTQIPKEIFIETINKMFNYRNYKIRVHE